MRLRLFLPWLALVTSTALSADPGWWDVRGVKTTAPAANLAPATIGQAKHMAAMALAELEDKLPPATHQALAADLGQIVDLALPDPLPPGFHENQRAVLLTGQLKAMAKPFYDHLRTHDSAWLDNAMTAGNLVVMEPGSNPPTPSPYPWSEDISDDANRAPATLGQLKAVFSLPLETLSNSSTMDTDGDGIPDWWETQYGLNSNDPSDAGQDSDGDGLTNLQEFLRGTNPTNSDSDGDGITDGEEANGGSNPNNPNSTPQDRDGDGLVNDLDSVADDAEINWKRTPECRYVWVEQVTMSTMPAIVSPIAVNSSGLILFNRYSDVAGPAGTGINTLWDSSTRQWVPLAEKGSQSVDGITFECPVAYFSDINDAGVVTGIGNGSGSGGEEGHIDYMQPGMLWKQSEGSSTYQVPTYFAYHGAHGEGWCDNFLESYPGLMNDISETRIGEDGSVNLSAYTGTYGSLERKDWVMLDAGTNAPLIENSIMMALGSGLADHQESFSGAILDKDRAMFVRGDSDEEYEIWLKNGTTVECVTKTIGWFRNTDLVKAPTNKGGGGDRLWMSASNKVLLEKRSGSGWHQPPSMAQGVYRLSSQGIAITRGEPDAESAIPPKLWRNGIYTDLNAVTSKPEAVNITQAIDLASNGIILVTAQVGETLKTGLLLPIDIVAHKRGTINLPGDEQPKGNGEYGYETVMMENADSEDNPTGTRDCDTAAVDKAKDDDYVQIVLYYSGLKIEGASLELQHEGIAVDAKIKGSEMNNPEDAIEVLNTGSRLKFYREDGTLIEDPATDLKIANLKNPDSSYLAQILDPAKNGKLTLFIEGADDFGSVGPSLGPVIWNHTNTTVTNAKAAAQKLGGSRLKFTFQMGDQKAIIPVLVYRGGFLVFKQPNGMPGTTGNLEFWDGKGRIRHKYAGYENEFDEDDTDQGIMLHRWSAKSGLLKTADNSRPYNKERKGGHIPPGWWINHERTDFNISQMNQESGEERSKKITQGSYCRWVQDDAAAEGRYTKDYKYDASEQKDFNIGVPTSINFKFELMNLPPSSQQSRKNIQIHPDGNQNGTLGCIGIQKYEGCVEVARTLRSYNNLKIKVVTN